MGVSARTWKKISCPKFSAIREHIERNNSSRTHANAPECSVSLKDFKIEAHARYPSDLPILEAMLISEKRPDPNHTAEGLYIFRPFKGPQWTRTPMHSTCPNLLNPAPSIQQSRDRSSHQCKQSAPPFISVSLTIHKIIEYLKSIICTVIYVHIHKGRLNRYCSQGLKQSLHLPFGPHMQHYTESC